MFILYRGKIILLLKVQKYISYINSHLEAELQLSKELGKDSLMVIVFVSDVEHLIYLSFHQLDNGLALTLSMRKANPSTCLVRGQISFDTAVGEGDKDMQHSAERKRYLLSRK